MASNIRELVVGTTELHMPRQRRGLRVRSSSCVGALLLTSACWFDGRFESVPESICASGEIWTYTDKDSPLMNPGRSCVACHAEENDPTHAPLYTVAGTVMADLHDADDCRGSAGMSVILTDADGTEWVMTGNSAGNFWLDPDAFVAMPYVARIVDADGNERLKQNPVAEGDCASCHTRDGVGGALGRLIPPDVFEPSTAARP